MNYKDWIDQWKKNGAFTSANNYIPYFSFEKDDLLSLLEDPQDPDIRLADGIRFHFAKDPNVNSEGDKKDYCMIATGIKNNNGSGKLAQGKDYLTLWDKQVINTEHTAQFIIQEAFDFDIRNIDDAPTTAPLPLQEAKKWTALNQQIPFDPKNINIKHLAVDEQGNLTKLLSVGFENDINKDILLNFIQSSPDHKIFVFLATKMEYLDLVKPFEYQNQLSTFILSHYDNLSNTMTKGGATDLSGGSDPLEFGHSCPPCQS